MRAAELSCEPGISVNGAGVGISHGPGAAPGDEEQQKPQDDCTEADERNGRWPIRKVAENRDAERRCSNNRRGLPHAAARLPRTPPPIGDSQAVAYHLSG